MSANPSTRRHALCADLLLSMVADACRQRIDRGQAPGIQPPVGESMHVVFAAQLTRVNRFQAGRRILDGHRSESLDAAGVETRKQRDMLAEMGRDELRGYLFAKPMSAAELTLW